MKKRAFNWVDGVAIALVILLIAGAVWYFLRGRKTAAPEKDYLVTMRFTQSTVDSYDFYKIGDQMYFFARSEPMGRIVSLRQVETVYETFDRTGGTFVKATDKKNKTVEMKVAVKGTVEDGAFMVNGEWLYMGRTFYPQTDTTRSVMVIWGIEEVQK